jgi:uncharacterized membrane protein YcaP (DUF421 family)
MSLLLVFAQTLAIYLFLVVAMGRLRQTALEELNPSGYLITALMGSAVETGLYRGSDSLSAGLVSAATLMAANYATARLLNRFPRLRRWLVGVPLVLVHSGQILSSSLRKVHMTEENLRAAIRERGYDSVAAIRLAILEPDGSVGVIPMKQVPGRPT